MNRTKQLARLAGLLYLLLGIACLYGVLHIPLVRGDATTVANVFAASEFRFRVAIVSDLLSNIIGIFLVFLLYRLLKPVDENQAALMVTLLLVTMPVTFVISLNDIAAQLVMRDPESVSAFTQPQRDALARVFLGVHTHGVFAVEVFWGLWLFPFGLLVYRSGFLPRILGVLLIISGCAYVIHSFVCLMLPGPRNATYELVTMVGRGVGEIPIMFWLLIKGVDVEQLQAQLGANG